MRWQDYWRCRQCGFMVRSSCGNARRKRWLFCSSLRELCLTEFIREIQKLRPSTPCTTALPLASSTCKCVQPPHACSATPTRSWRRSRTTSKSSQDSPPRTACSPSARSSAWLPVSTPPWFRSTTTTMRTSPRRQL